MPRGSWHYRQIKCQPARFDLTEFEWRCKGRNDLIDKNIYTRIRRMTLKYVEGQLRFSYNISSLFAH
jgi:hypothetical protein